MSEREKNEIKKGLTPRRIIFSGIVLGFLFFLVSEIIQILCEFEEFSWENSLKKLLVNLIGGIVFIALIIIVMKEDKRRNETTYK